MKSWDPEASFASRLHRHLSDRLAGQHEAIQDVVRALVPRVFHNIFRERTCGVFLFVGPSGSGKGTMAESLAEVLLGDADRLIRLNCSLFQEGGHSLSLLTPTPPTAARSSPCPDLRIVLLESIERSSQALLDLWTHIFAHGKIGLDGGPPLSFQRTLFILKSAVGQRQIDTLKRQRGVGFSSAEAADREIEWRKRLNRSIDETFPPRFLYYMTRVVHFRPLAEDDLRTITDRLVDQCCLHFRSQGIVVVVDELVREHLNLLGCARTRWGAKGLRQVMVENLFYPISDLILSGRVVGPCEVWVKKGDQELVFCIPEPILGRNAPPPGAAEPGRAPRQHLVTPPFPGPYFSGQST